MKIKRMLSLIMAALLTLSLAACSDGGDFASFTADTLDGAVFTQKDIASKDLTVVNFWGTFCSPCIAEMPDLAAFEKALPENVQLITVCVDAAGNEEIAKFLMEQAGYEGVTLTDGDGSLVKLLEEIQAVPTTIFVGPDGKRIGNEILGRQPDLEAAYLSAINSALKELGKAEISLED